MIRQATIGLAALACAGLAAPARAERWTGVDKAAHLGVSAALGASCYALLWAFGDDPPALRLAAAAGLALLPGLAKEMYDGGQPGNRFSGADLFWDGVGAALGSLALLGLERLLGRPVPRVKLTANRSGAALAAPF